MSNIPTSIEDRAAIRKALDQISEEYTNIETSRSQIKEILNALEDKHKTPKKTMSKVAKLYHKQSVSEFESEASEIKAIYKTIVS